MSAPIQSPTPMQTYPCFSCHQQSITLFAKINRGALQYCVCRSDCLGVALARLGIMNPTDRTFTSPVNITVRQSPSAFVNHSRSPITRSPESTELDKIGEPSSVDIESDPDPDCLKQIEQLARKRLRMDET